MAKSGSRSSHLLSIYRQHPQASVYIIFGFINGLITLVLALLVATNTIHWNWVTGQLLAFLTVILAFSLSTISWKTLIKTENFYWYYFLNTLKLGLYGFPLILSLLIASEPFSWLGVVVGLMPILIIPFFQNWLFKQQSSATLPHE